MSSREYELTVRQEPKQARMCGVGGMNNKSQISIINPTCLILPYYLADRRPIDPPPIIQLRVIDPQTRQPPSPARLDADESDPSYAHSFLQNPYYFMFASLAKPDDDTELHWLKVYFLSSPSTSPSSYLLGWENTLYRWFSSLLSVPFKGYRKSQRGCWLLRLPGP